MFNTSWPLYCSAEKGALAKENVKIVPLSVYFVILCLVMMLQGYILFIIFSYQILVCVLYSLLRFWWTRHR